MTTSPDTIRKAAIVIASLDEASADRLLDSMPEEVASQIRWMSVELNDVSDEERQAVLDEFLRNSGRALPPAPSGVELELTYEQNPPATTPPATSTPPPFAFLNDAPSEMLAPFFEQEHPQVTAVVMSYLSPERSSEILRHLSPSLQADIVHRITHLDEPDQKVVADIEQRIKQIVSRQTLAFRRRQIGLAAAEAILKASSQEQAQQLLESLRSRDARLWDQLDVVREQPPAAADPFAFLPTEAPLQSTSAAEPLPTADSGEAPQASQKPPKAESAPARPVPVEEAATPPVPAVLPPRFPFERFATLDDAALAKVLHRTGPQVVLLALCGASPQVMRRISRGLGTRDVKRLEQKIRDMQPVLLADIDRAQAEMCRAADVVLGGSADAPRSQLQAAA